MEEKRERKTKESSEGRKSTRTSREKKQGKTMMAEKTKIKKEKQMILLDHLNAVSTKTGKEKRKKEVSKENLQEKQRERI